MKIISFIIKFLSLFNFVYKNHYLCVLFKLVFIVYTCLIDFMIQVAYFNRPLMAFFKFMWAYIK